LSYIRTLQRAHDIAAADQAAKNSRGLLASVISSMAAIRHEIPKLRTEVENGQELLLIWVSLATSAAKIWLPAISKLKVLAAAWKVKQKQALVIHALILRVWARKHLCDAIVLDKVGPRMILGAKIARKRVACRVVVTFLAECRSVYTAVKNMKKFRAKFVAARNMVLRHLETKYYRIRWLLTLWNKMERSRLMASR
jgi:hypothetical protein